jgi:hypothetical protein
MPTRTEAWRLPPKRERTENSRCLRMNAEGMIWDALRGGLVTRALGLAADLRVAQALAAGPRSHDALARERGVDADVLYRVLRALASDGIFEETKPGVFGNTAASEVLARDGWDDLAHLFGGTWLHAVAALDASGEASFPRVHSDEFWAWLAAHPDERRRLRSGDGARLAQPPRSAPERRLAW